MIYAGILAGGTGTRMGISNIPKQFMMLGNKPIVIHTIEKFLLIPDFEKIVVGVHPDWIDYMNNLIDEYLPEMSHRLMIVEGGQNRNSTIEQIIQAIHSYQTIQQSDLIVTHDSVRPFITLRIIRDNIEQAMTYEAIDTVVPATDTIVESVNGTDVSAIPNRSFLYQGQTPQTFKMETFLDLYSQLNETDKNILTDACKVFLLNKKQVGLVQGDYSNIKITTVIDLEIAHAMLEDN